MENMDKYNNIRESRNLFDYDTKNFIIQDLISMVEKEDLILPENPKRVWISPKKNLFLESIFLGLPIPIIAITSINNYGKREIIDGARRIQTLIEFYNNEFQLEGLEVLSALNGFYFKDLSDFTQRTFLEKWLRTVVFETDDPEIMRDIYERLNK